jgi:xanthine dehydrogenase accessory factor
MTLSTLDLSPAAPGRDTWVVVASMGHDDEDALEAALAHPDADVALVASARRAAAVLDGLRRRGVDEATLARVRTPAGGRRAGGQAQIAVLVLAEVITRREDRRRTARDRSVEPANPSAEHACHCH